MAATTTTKAKRSTTKAKAAVAAPVRSVALDDNGIPAVWKLRDRAPTPIKLNDTHVTVEIQWSDKLTLTLPAFPGDIERAAAVAAKIIKQGWIVPARWNKATYPIF